MHLVYNKIRKHCKGSKQKSQNPREKTIDKLTRMALRFLLSFCKPVSGKDKFRYQVEIAIGKDSLSASIFYCAVRKKTATLRITFVYPSKGSLRL
ncbi:hypothetical protein CLI76_10165 [Porphyromonas gingivalis]|nr:hypothetical protein CLI76_10165 [Porphyromonas gingivalis]